jgi:hypothetical protein
MKTTLSRWFETAEEKAFSVPGAMTIAADSIPLEKISSRMKATTVLVLPLGLMRVCRGKCCCVGPAAVITAFLIFMSFKENGQRTLE